MDLITEILSLERLMIQVEEMKIPQRNKEKILNVIDFEIHLIKSEIMKDLGQKAYDNLRKDKI